LNWRIAQLRIVAFEINVDLFSQLAVVLVAFEQVFLVLVVKYLQYIGPVIVAVVVVVGVVGVLLLVLVLFAVGGDVLGFRVLAFCFFYLNVLVL
jgi:hypothetical protein